MYFFCNFDAEFDKFCTYLQTYLVPISRTYYKIVLFHSLQYFYLQSHLGLNEHHDALVLNYMRFAKFQRTQCLQAIKNSFEDAKDTR